MKINLSFPVLSFLACPITALLMAGPARAQIATWSGATNGIWNTNTNWVLGGAPNGVSSDAIFNSANNGQSALSVSGATSVRTMYLYGGNYTFGGATALNIGGGGGFAQLGSGTWTVNNNLTGAGDIAFTGTGTGAFTFNGTISNGANRFDKFNESDVTLTNAYTTTNATTSALRIRAGNLILSGAGSITQGAAAQITIGASGNYTHGVFHNNANAGLVLDNTGTNNTNRITDGNQINTGARSLIDFKGNASAASSETLGILNASGPGSRIRVSNGSGQSSQLTFASLQVNNAVGNTVDTNGNPTILQFLVPTGSTLGAAGAAGSRVIFTTAPTLTNGVLRYGVIKDESIGGGATFATYDTTVDNGAALGVKALAAYTTTTLSGATNTQNVDATGSITLGAASAVNALRINTSGSGQSLTMGSNTLTFANAAGMIFNGGNDYAINNTSGSGITFSNVGYVFINSNTLTINAPVVKSTELVKAGDGALVINGAFNNASARHLGVDDGAAADDMTINGAISGAAQLNKAGWGTLVLGGSGNNSAFAGDGNGSFALSSGTVVLDKSSSGLQNTALGSGTIAMNGGTLAARNTAAVLANTVNFTQQGSASSASNFTGNKAITFTGLAQGALNSGQVYIVANNIATESLTFSGTMQGFSSNRVGGANSTFEFNGTGTTIVTGVIRNTDPTFLDAATMTTGLNKTGPGLLILQNANTYTGFLQSSTASTGIQGGYLRADAAGALGTGNLLISEANFSFGMNAVLELGAGNTTFSRNLGTSGVNTVQIGSTSGNALNNGGFASVSGTSVINLNGGVAAVTYGTTGFFGSGGNLTLGSPNVAGTVDFQNAINLAGGTTSNVTRTINTLNGSAVVDGIISGVIATTSGTGTLNGIRKTGLGTLSLTNANTYSGATTVSEGTLLANNSLGSATGTGLVTVSPFGTLGGAGFISGDTTIAGTLSPGNSAGLLTFNDGTPGAPVTDLTLQGNAIFEINGLTRSALYDAVDVEGLLTYGGTLILDFANGFGSPNNTFNLFDFGTSTGTFSGVNFVDPGYSGDFDHASGVLTLTAVPEPSALMMLLGGTSALAFFRRRRAA